MAKAIEAFGKYLLLERIASGGMAEVYLSKSVGASGIGKFVAMKRILPQFSDNQEFVDMFKEEAKIVMNLNHANIVTIFDFGIEKNQFYLVMEFVEGQNLRQILNHLKKISKNLTIEQIVYILKEVSAGLDHAHRCIDATTGRQLNIIHRDMSPQNIMISFEGEVKIVDFGIAKAETQIEQTRAGTIKGKFGYMSPEQVEGLPVDARTDIFSIGIVLWELLAQDRLFTAQNEAATLRKIRECQIPPVRKLNPAVHPDLEKIVSKALTRDKNLRYQSSEALSKDLNRFLNTNFPDFSKQEFSKFMKSIYNEMYLENRKKLSEFAKIESAIRDSKSEEKTSITNTLTSTATATATETSTETKTETSTQSKEKKKKAKLAPDGLIPENNIPEASQKIDISKLMLENGDSHSTTRKSISLTSSYTQGNVRTGTVNTGTFSGTNPNLRKPLPPSQKTSSIGSWLLTLSLFAIAGYGAMVFLEDPQIAKNLQAMYARYFKSQRNPAEEPAKEKTPSTVPLNIKSSPSGATVYIDDQPIGQTPIISHIDFGKPFRLRLIKEGYLPYELPLEKANPEGYIKNLTMMPEPASGMITIEATNGGPNPIVYVNGQRYNEQLPFSTKIPAGTPIQIRVVNPVSKLEGSESVVVGQGQKKAVRIFLDRQAQL